MFYEVAGGDLGSPGDLPGLVGVLLAGGDNGKTEMIEGFTWSTAELESG